MNEREQAARVAKIWLDRADQFGAMDPDGDECVLARTYLRALEKIERLTALVPPDKDRAARELADKWPARPE